MMEKQKSFIQEDLTHAGEASLVTPELIQLDTYRVTPHGQFAEEEFLIRLKGQPCFPRKDLTSIAGQAKSGKTNLIAMVLACCTRPAEDRHVLNMQRIQEAPLKVMWIDTEQSQKSTQNILMHRIAKMLQVGEEEEGQPSDFPEELFFVFNLRPALIEDRYDLLAEAVEAYKPDLVVIDNIRDLVKDINDGVQAQTLIEGLMHMAEQYNCNITTVIHQNRSADNRGLRGWLGTELMNKVFEVFTCQKILQKQGEKPVFCIEQTLTRKYDIDEPMCYTIRDNGLPESCEQPVVQPRDAKGKFTAYDTPDPKSFNRAYIISHPDDSWEWNLRKLFSDCFGDRALMGYQDLMDTAMKLSLIKRSKYFEKVFRMAEEAKVVRADQDRCGRPVAMMLPQ